MGYGCATVDFCHACHVVVQAGNDGDYLERILLWFMNDGEALEASLN